MFRYLCTASRLEAEERRGMFARYISILRTFVAPASNGSDIIRKQPPLTKLEDIKRKKPKPTTEWLL